MKGICALLAVGCVAPPAGVDDWGEVDGIDLLVDHPEREFAERVTPLGAPDAALVPGGPLLERAGGAPPGRALVVVDPTPWPRVSVDAGDVQVLVYVDRQALEPRVVALADGAGPDGDGRVRLRPGVAIERLAEDEDRVQVRAELPFLRVEAWLPRAAVDEVWRDELREPPLGEPVDAPYRALAADAAILDRPGGEPLVVAGHATPVAVVGPDEEGFWPVVLDRHEVWVEGWVHDDDLGGALVGWRCASCGGFSTWGRSRVGRIGPSATVPAGTWLYAGPGGPVVGRALEDLAVPLEARELGATIARPTALGRVELWAAPEDVM